MDWNGQRERERNEDHCFDKSISTASDSSTTKLYLVWRLLQFRDGFHLFSASMVKILPTLGINFIR